MTMALKPSQISRRNFVQRAGLLVSALGVGASVQAGLMDTIVKKATKKWGSEALAANASSIAFHVEISFRAGFQLNSLFPSMGHSQISATTLAANPAINFYSSANNVLQKLAPTGGANPFYTANFNTTATSANGVGSGVGADGLGTYLSTNAVKMGYGAASSEAITLIDGQHTANFLQRAPSSSVACPAVLHAALAQATPVTGVAWNSAGAAVTNQTGSFPALASVSSQADMIGLYKDLPMYFHPDEMQLIAGAFNANNQQQAGGSIDKMDKLFAVKNVPGTADVATVSVTGRGQAQLNIATALQTQFTALTTGAGPFASIINTAPLSTTDASAKDLAASLAMAVAAFSIGALNTMHISLDSADWHGNISALDDGTAKQGGWNLYVGNALTAFMTAMDAGTSTLLGANAKMSSSFLLSLNSEFTRTPNRNGGGAGSDNGDGGSGAFAFIGTNVKSGTFGNITPAGALQSFNPATGAVDTTGSFSVNEANLWMAHGNLLGISTSTLAGMLPGTASIPGLTKYS